MPVIPFAFQWSIPEHELLDLGDSLNERLESAFVSNVPGIGCYLRLDRNASEHAWIFLILYIENVEEVEADYTVLIESANYCEKIQNTFTKIMTCCPVFCDEFSNPEKNFIVDGKCTIKINGIFKFETDDDASTSEYQKWEGGELGNDLWEDDGDKNFTIVVEDNELQVHKLFLRTRSDVFRAMFNPETKESIENKVEIPDFSFEVVETAVKMIYNCGFTSALSLDETMSLLQFFDKYQIPLLKDKVELLLINKISAATVCLFANCSIITNSINLKKKSMEFLEKSVASKTYVSDIAILDNDVLKKVVQNSFYKDIVTKQF